MKIEEKAKIRRRKNPEEANIRKRQKCRKGTIQRKAKIWRRQKYGGVKNQEEAIAKSGGGKK